MTGNSFAEHMLGEGQDFERYLDCTVRLQLRIHSYQAIEFAGLKVGLAARIAATAFLTTCEGLSGSRGIQRMIRGGVSGRDLLPGQHDHRDAFVYLVDNDVRIAGPNLGAQPEQKAGDARPGSRPCSSCRRGR